jgi:hypothetical protein
VSFVLLLDGLTICCVDFNGWNVGFVEKNLLCHYFGIPGVTDFFWGMGENFYFF